jgi:hypothetical protein
MTFAISTSKPSTLPETPFRPNSGWSNFVPTLTLPALLSRSIVEPAANFLSPETPSLPSSSLQATVPNVRAAATANVSSLRVRIERPFLVA